MAVCESCGLEKVTCSECETEVCPGKTVILYKDCSRPDEPDYIVCSTCLYNLFHPE